MQTIFPKPNLKYFPVTTPPTDSNRDASDPIQNMLKAAKVKDERDFQERNIIVGAEPSRVERTPWLNRAGWLQMFSGLDMKALCQATSEKVAEGENLAILGMSVERVISQCLTGVINCDKRGWALIRFWLQSTDQTKADKKPFIYLNHVIIPPPT
jgi:hypothetical protein